MPINFIPNDPDDSQMAVVQLPQAATRPANRITFTQAGLPPQTAYAAGTDDFVAWQAREAALRALNAFEGIDGVLVGWRREPLTRTIDLIVNAGAEINAYYTRQSVKFYKISVGGKWLYSGASTEVVAHEVGHGILDALRPDLWQVPMLEVSAFHEGFGDCIAIMTVLSDQATRQKLLQVDPQLAGANFVEAFGEQLAWGISKAFPNHNASVPRRARNTYQWKIPDQLPVSGGPGALIAESHSMGQLLSGCYYDIIRGIYAASAGGQAALWTACQTATRLLARAVSDAPVKPRFFQAVGRTMLLADATLFGGANSAIIRKAYEDHGLAIGASTMLAPQATLASTPPSVTAAGVLQLGPSARRMVRQALSVADDAKVSLAAFGSAAETVVKAIATHDIDLSGLAEGLAGVVAPTPTSAFVGDVDGAATLLGAVDSPMVVGLEVRNYVEAIVRQGKVDFGRGRPRGGSGAVASRTLPTHAIRKRGARMVLERIAFTCACCPAPSRTLTCDAPPA
jgi:hypothetical protein